MTSAFVPLPDGTVSIRFSVEELAMLTLLAEGDGLGIDEEVRQLVRARYAERFDRAHDESR